MKTVCHAELQRVETEYLLSEHAFTSACDELNEFYKVHGVTPGMLKTPHGILVHVNVLRLKHPELRRLETRQREALCTRNKLLKERAEVRKACGLIR